MAILVAIIMAMVGLVVTHGNPFTPRTATTQAPKHTATATAASASVPTATTTSTPIATPTPVVSPTPTVAPTATAAASPGPMALSTPTSIIDVLGMEARLCFIANTNRLGVRVRLDCVDHPPWLGAWPEGTWVVIEDARADCPGWVEVRRVGGEKPWVRIDYLSISFPPGRTLPSETQVSLAASSTATHTPTTTPTTEPIATPTL